MGNSMFGRKTKKLTYLNALESKKEAQNYTRRNSRKDHKSLNSLSFETEKKIDIHFKHSTIVPHRKCFLESQHATVILLSFD